MNVDTEMNKKATRRQEAKSSMNQEYWTYRAADGCKRKGNDL